jgi:hypothetical protein
MTSSVEKILKVSQQFVKLDFKAAIAIGLIYRSPVVEGTS